MKVSVRKRHRMISHRNMNWRIPLLAAAVGMAAVACQKENAPEAEVPRVDIIKAIQADEETTRTELTDRMRILWSPEDEITVFRGGLSAPFTSDITEPSAQVDFSGTLPADKGEIWGLYPRNDAATFSNGLITTTLASEQTATAESFTNKMNISLGHSENMEMTFYNVCSLVKFSLLQEGIKTVTITARGGEDLAGDITIGMDDNDRPQVTAVSNGTSTITLNAPEGETFTPGVWYYIVTLPTELSQGLTFTVSTGKLTGTREIKTPFSLRRSIASRCADMDKNIYMERDESVTKAGKFVYATHSVVYDEEFRAVWVATVKRIGFPTTNGAEAQQAELVQLFTDMKALGFNAIIFQVCPMADAFWQSEILPWSQYLTGTQGQDPGYDPLALAVETAHSLGMELHAWFNPLRIGPTSDTRVSTHPMYTYPKKIDGKTQTWVHNYKDSYYWDPGYPACREFLASIMEEVVTHYAVDGTHIDDYFYPSGLKGDANTDWPDYAPWVWYNEDDLPKLDWRIGNIDQLMDLYHTTIRQKRPSAVFGIAPAGHLSGCHNLNAYPEHWVSAGSMDYLSPQLYWDHVRTDNANFDSLLDQWMSLVDGSPIPLMPGLAPYMVYDAGTSYYYYHHPDELLYQMERIREEGLLGALWYRDTYCLRDLLINYIPENVLIGDVLSPQLSTTPGSLPAPIVTVNGTELSWGTVQGAANYVVLEITRRGSTSKKWDAAIVASGADLHSFTGVTGKYYIVLARCGSVRSGYSEVIYLQ